MKSFTDLQNLYTTLTNNNDSANQTFGMELVNDSIRRVCSDRDWDFLQKTANINTVGGTQFYNLPYDYNTLIDTYITLGTTKYIPKECPTQEMWDTLNQQSTFQSDFPEWYFIFNGQIGYYPIPSSTQTNAITVNYRRSVIDLSIADYVTGTISSTNGSTTLTGSGTTWTTPMIGRFIRITSSNTAASSGDMVWYEITNVTSTTSITLKKAYNGTSITGGSYIIGQMPALPEPYHDMPVYDASRIFYTSINPDKTRADGFRDKFDELFTKLSADHGTKTLDPAIHDVGAWPQQNPNNFITL